MISIRAKKLIRALAGSTLCSMLIITCVGCSGGYSLAPVSGTVTVDGKPLPDATVTFTPIAAGADAPSSFGRTDQSGNSA